MTKFYGLLQLSSVTHRCETLTPYADTVVGMVINDTHRSEITSQKKGAKIEALEKLVKLSLQREQTAGTQQVNRHFKAARQKCKSFRPV